MTTGLSDFFQYNLWANLRLLDACTHLSDAQLDATTKGTFGSVRETLMQLWTPDDVRGRVNAVNSVFIGASNELGEFRAGMVAWKLGAVTAVVVGGVGTMMVAGIWARMFPKLRDARKLTGRD